MDGDLNCPLCDTEYTDENLPKLIAVCGHTFCERCLNKMLSRDGDGFKIVCPEDSEVLLLRDGDLSSVPKNIALFKIIESKKKNSSFKDPELEMSKISKSDDAVNDDSEAHYLVDVLTLQNNDRERCGVLSSEDKADGDAFQQSAIVDGKGNEKNGNQGKVEQQSQLCKIHKKPLEVVCVIDLIRICANCAIFGEHKGHQFRSVEEIETERIGYYTELLQIMEKKQKAIERISNKEVCSSIMELLSNKKEQMKSQINEKYKKLVESVESKRKETVKNIDSTAQMAEAKLSSLMKIDAKIMEKYDDWEEKSYEQLKVLEGNDFEAKVELLFSQPTQQADIIEEGESIIEEMNKQQESMLNEVESVIGNIGVDFNLEIFDYIDSFVQVYDQPKQKQSKESTNNTEVPLPSQTATADSDKQLQQEGNSGREELPTENLKLNTSKQSIKTNSQLEQDFLQIVCSPIVKKPQFVSASELTFTTGKTEHFSIKKQKGMLSPSSKQFERAKAQHMYTQSMVFDVSSLNNEFFVNSAVERPNKKKLSKVKWPQKYEKVIQGIANGQLDTVDLTNAELGDKNVVLLSQFIGSSKVKTLKLIRNKLTDEGVDKMLPYLKGVITLNLSQNMLSEKVLDSLISKRAQLFEMRNVVLSQNKITQRKAKPKLDKLKSLDYSITL